MEDADHYRCRRIYLKQSDDTKLQAEVACEALAKIEGILVAAAHSEYCVHIIYSLDQISFEIINDLLVELEFEIDNSLLSSFRNTIYDYLEDNARDNLHVDETGQLQGQGESHEKPHQDNDQYWDDYR